MTAIAITGRKRMIRSWHRLTEHMDDFHWPSPLPLLTHPRQMGAIAESSRFLAQQMVHAIDFSQPGLIVELGPGRGAITRAIFKKIPNRQNLILIEVGHEFIPLLHKRFPGATIINDSAENLAHYIGERKVAAVVSGLPLRSLSTHVTNKIGQAIHQVMGADSRYIQFTYDLRPTKDAFFSKVTFHKIHSKIVWPNLPPARVDIFTKKH